MHQLQRRAPSSPRTREVTIQLYESATRSRSRRVCGAASAAAATIALYSVGITRAFGYDAAVTVQNFVRTPSIWDPWRRQIVFNNHPMFSFLERLVYAVTGSTSEVTMRVLPVLFAGAAVGAAVWFLSERWSLIGSLLGGLLLAVNPVVLANGRDVRGYSLMLLCTVVSSAMVVRTSRRSRVVYLVALVVGATTHVYVLVVVPCHLVYLLVRRRSVRPWVPLWATTVAIAAVAFIPSISSVGGRGRHFQLDFPLMLVQSGLGVAVPAMAATAIVIALGTPRCTDALWAVVLAAVIVVPVWLIGPQDLYTRFFVWAAPLIALAVAVAITRRPVVAVVALVAVVLTLAPRLSTLRSDQVANRSGAQLLASYTRPCVLGWSGEALGPYQHANVVATNAPSDIGKCDAVLVIIPHAHPQIVAVARRRFTHERVLPAGTPGLLFTDPGP